MVVGIDKVTREIDGKTVEGSIVSIWTGNTVKQAAEQRRRPMRT